MGSAAGACWPYKALLLLVGIVFSFAVFPALVWIGESTTDPAIPKPFLPLVRYQVAAMERLRLPEVTPAPLLALAVSSDEPRRILAVVDFLTVVPIVFATVMLLLTSAIAVLTAVIYIFQEEINGVPMAKQELKFIWGWIHGHVVSGEFLPVDLAARWFARCA